MNEQHSSFKAGFESFFNKEATVASTIRISQDVEITGPRAIALFKKEASFCRDLFNKEAKAFGKDDAWIAGFEKGAIENVQRYLAGDFEKQAAITKYALSWPKFFNTRNFSSLSNDAQALAHERVGQFTGGMGGGKDFASFLQTNPHPLNNELLPAHMQSLGEGLPAPKPIMSTSTVPPIAAPVATSSVPATTTTAMETAAKPTSPEGNWWRGYGSASKPLQSATLGSGVGMLAGMPLGGGGMAAGAALGGVAAPLLERYGVRGALGAGAGLAGVGALGTAGVAAGANYLTGHGLNPLAPWDGGTVDGLPENRNELISGVSNKFLGMAGGAILLPMLAAQTGIPAPILAALGAYGGYEMLPELINKFKDGPGVGSNRSDFQINQQGNNPASQNMINAQQSNNSMMPISGNPVFTPNTNYRPPQPSTPNLPQHTIPDSSAINGNANSWNYHL